MPVTHAARLPREHPPRRGAPSEGGTEGPCAWPPVAPRGGTRNAGMPELRCGGSARGYQSDLRNVCGPAATRGQFNMQTRSEYLCIASFTEDARFCRQQGLPDCHGAGTSVRRCMPHGVRHPDGEADRRSRRRGRAAGTPARTIRMPPVSSIWIPGRRWAPALGHPAGRTPAGGHARVRRGGAGRHGPGRQGAGGCGCPERPSPCSGITLSDEGVRENARGPAVRGGHRIEFGGLGDHAASDVRRGDANRPGGVVLACRWGSRLTSRKAREPPRMRGLPGLMRQRLRADRWRGLAIACVAGGPP